MSYDFSFNQKTISFLLGGSAFVGIMLFIAGLLVGANLKTEPTTLAAVTSPQPVATAATTAPPAPATEAVPKEPVLKAEAATPQVAAPAEVTAPSVVAPASVKQAHSNAPAESRPSLALPPLREGAAGDVKIIQRADTGAAEDEDAVGSNQLAFSVQVGVFVDQNMANQLVRRMQSKGYRPIILTANDDESRRWYAVRVGAYANRTEAAEAAANIGTQEKIKAVVRPLGSL